MQEFEFSTAPKRQKTDILRSTANQDIRLLYSKAFLKILFLSKDQCGTGRFQFQ